MIDCRQRHLSFKQTNRLLQEVGLNDISFDENDNLFLVQVVNLALKLSPIRAF